jgi:hypothetical protein
VRAGALAKLADLVAPHAPLAEPSHLLAREAMGSDTLPLFGTGIDTGRSTRAGFEEG